MRATSSGWNSRSKVRLAEISLSITSRSCGAAATRATSNELSQYPQFLTTAMRCPLAATALDLPGLEARGRYAMTSRAAIEMQMRWLLRAQCQRAAELQKSGEASCPLATIHSSAGQQQQPSRGRS